MQIRKAKRRIEICGGVGIGKSTLASRLAARLPKSQLICEDFRANPLWAAYYEAPATFIREKNISFIAQHFAEIKHGTADTLIADFSTLQDLAYARLAGDADHEKVMRVVHAHLQNQIGYPTLVVHLVATVERQLSQIALRGRPEETLLSAELLANLNSSLATVLASEIDPHTLKVIDLTSVDLRQSTRIIDELVENL